ncbi:hypothetical protein C0Q70_09581 [Pomacea canaliculata]|uniref:Uncharacterized protein n=1 Tax=Pomacea canaliculata TaxID=400727 RepID=A0A2T7PA70_POMCA|nr:hypothetical protein C0Q70_09581 [Pomacea canaliculata]
MTSTDASTSGSTVSGSITGHAAYDTTASGETGRYSSEAGDATSTALLKNVTSAATVLTTAATTLMPETSGSTTNAFTTYLTFTTVSSTAHAISTTSAVSDDSSLHAESSSDHVTSQSTAAVAPTGSSEPAVVQTSKTSHHVTSPGFLETTVGPASDTTPVPISPSSSGSTSGSKTQQSLSKGTDRSKAKRKLLTRDESSNKVIFIVVGVVVGVVCVAIVIVLILVIRRKRFPLMSTAHSIEELAINRSRDPFRPISIVNFFNRKFSRSDIENDYNAMSSDRGAAQENATPFIMNSFKGELPPGGSERSTSFSYSSDPADGLHNDTARERTISWSEEEGEKAAGSV